MKALLAKAVLNGYVCNVGCQTLVFGSRAELIRELDSYLDKPAETERRYRETAVNRDLLNVPQPAKPCPPPQGMATTATECAGNAIRAR